MPKYILSKDNARQVNDAVTILSIMNRLVQGQKIHIDKPFTFKTSFTKDQFRKIYSFCFERGYVLSQVTQTLHTNQKEYNKRPYNKRNPLEEFALNTELEKQKVERLRLLHLKQVALAELQQRATAEAKAEYETKKLIRQKSANFRKVQEEIRQKYKGLTEGLEDSFPTKKSHITLLSPYEEFLSVFEEGIDDEAESMIY